MEKTTQVLTILMGILLVITGSIHFISTRSYLHIVPEFFPGRILIIQLSGVLELVTGIALFIPATRHMAALMSLVLMIGFLPLHIWDVFRDRPAMGSTVSAILRLGLQFVLIAWAWYIFLRSTPRTIHS